MTNRLYIRELRTKRGNSRSGLSTVQGLEPRVFLAHHPLFNLSGRVFNDVNGDGARGPKEHWLGGATIYLDLNHNGSDDAGEPTITTNPSGTFNFRKQAAGTYRVVQIPPTGMVATSAGNAIDIDVTNSKHGITNLRFGDSVTPAGPTTPPMPGDALGPIAVLNAQPLSVAGGSTYSFTVTYLGETGVSVASLSGGNLSVTENGNAHVTPTLVSLDASSDGPMRIATYQISAPGGTWDAADNGAYAINLLANQVFDDAHNAAAATLLGSIPIAIGQTVSATPDAPVLVSTSDTGTFNNDDITNLNNHSKASALTFSVSGTVAGDDVTLFADGIEIGSAHASGGTTTINSDGSTALVDGTHLITARQTTHGEVTSGNSDLLGIVIDTQPATASSVPSDVTATGATSYTFAVLYHDDIAVDISQLNTGDITVTGPQGFSQTATFVSVNSNSSGSPRTATYSITPSGGSWQATANGTYTLTLQGGQIFDIAGNASPTAVLATFAVGQPGGTTNPPGGTGSSVIGFNAANVSTSGDTTYSFTVTYSPDQLINITALLGSEVIVTAPDGKILSTSIASVSKNSDKSATMVTYQLTPPGGFWDAPDNGNYQISRKTAGILGLLSSPTPDDPIGSFTVNIKAGPPGPADPTPPKKPKDKGGDENDPGAES